MIFEKQAVKTHGVKTACTAKLLSILQFSHICLEYCIRIIIICHIIFINKHRFHINYPVNFFPIN